MVCNDRLEMVKNNDGFVIHDIVQKIDNLQNGSSTLV